MILDTILNNRTGLDRYFRFCNEEASIYFSTTAIPIIASETEVFDMDRIEIVACRSNGEAVFLGFREQWFLARKWLKWSRAAGQESTFRRPLNCPKGERFGQL
jgi:hypothetical protein